MCFYPGPNDCGDKEQVRLLSNKVQVKVISEGGHGPFCDTHKAFVCFLRCSCINTYIHI